MSVAVVFDSAGTLLNTYRVAKDICNQKLLPGIETTTLTFSSPDRVLIVLPVHSKDLMATPAGDTPLGIPCPARHRLWDQLHPEDHDRRRDRGCPLR